MSHRIVKCYYCDKTCTRNHARHDTGGLENLCEKHYFVWHPEISKWKPNQMEKWVEYFIVGDKRTHFIAMPKGIKLWYTKFSKYAYVDFDLYSTQYQLTKEGENAFWQLYKEVANKKSHAFLSHLTLHMKIPKSKLDYTITKLMEILSTNLEDDPKLKKFKEEFGIEPKTVPS